VFVARSVVRVLIVDDLEQFCAAARVIVLDELVTPEIVESGDGRSAVRLAEQLQPDLILLDIGLPELNGIEAAKQIRAVSPASKIIFVTQNNDHELQQAALEIGAETYVSKMNAPRELPKAIRAALHDRSFPTSRPARSARVQ
jgi:DNA-binding NarL/FixJ family response regulator